MKNFLKSFLFVALVAVLAFATLAFAQEADPVVPSWAPKIFSLLLGIKLVGPVLALIAKLAGTIGAIFTTVYASFWTIVKTLQGAGYLMGLQDKPWAVALGKIVDKVLYVLKYLSVLNAQAQPAPAAPTAPAAEAPKQA